MPRRINNTFAPRNHITRAMANRGGGGAHQTSRTGLRQQARAAVEDELDDWREELAFEREHQAIISNQENESGSADEPLDQLLH